MTAVAAAPVACVAVRSPPRRRVLGLANAGGASARPATSTSAAAAPRAGASTAPEATQGEDQHGKRESREQRPGRQARREQPPARAVEDGALEQERQEGAQRLDLRARTDRAHEGLEQLEVRERPRRAEEHGEAGVHVELDRGDDGGNASRQRRRTDRAGEEFEAHTSGIDLSLGFCGAARSARRFTRRGLVAAHVEACRPGRCLRASRSPCWSSPCVAWARSCRRRAARRRRSCSWRESLSRRPGVRRRPARGRPTARMPRRRRPTARPRVTARPAPPRRGARRRSRTPNFVTYLARRTRARGGPGVGHVPPHVGERGLRADRRARPDHDLRQCGAVRRSWCPAAAERCRGLARRPPRLLLRNPRSRGQAVRALHRLALPLHRDHELDGPPPVPQVPDPSLNTTLALALCVFVYVQYIGISKNGILGYLYHFAGQPKDAVGWGRRSCCSRSRSWASWSSRCGGLPSASATS